MSSQSAATAREVVRAHDHELTKDQHKLLREIAMNLRAQARYTSKLAGQIDDLFYEIRKGREQYEGK